MTDTVEPLVADLIAWIGGGRPYPDVMDAWKTSCPRLPVWEEANLRGLLACSRDANGGEWVRVTPTGREFLRTRQLAQGRLEQDRT
ncbi:3-phosphoglycerate dehydrogenase [Ramlibacter sp. MMS24-I3-19]|uniref:3-phosphoglycerate dehydrogenase n=1 Tax=Ramlibacter sp. MMS24-I3-19 TaxID=3416606 RepID=UPI003D082539